MEYNISNLFGEIIKPNIKSERAEIVSFFIEEINKERVNTKWKPVNKKVIAIKLGVLKSNDELREFLSECRNYKNRHGSFSKRFYGGFKEQKFSPTSLQSDTQ